MMPTNVLASEDEMLYLLEHSESRLTFTTAEHLPLMHRCRDKLAGLADVVLCDPYTDHPCADSFEATLVKYADDFRECPAAATDMAAIMYTSGTTSKPKGVMVSHANYLKAGATVADAIELDENDRQFVVLPLFHGNAQYYSTMSALAARRECRFNGPVFGEPLLRQVHRVRMHRRQPVRGADAHDPGAGGKPASPRQTACASCCSRRR